jgi:hypothetical protein
VNDFHSGCICGCGRGQASTRGGKCVRCKVGDMAPGLAKSVATALLPLINSDLIEPADGLVWAKDSSGQAKPTISAVGRRGPEADIEAA